MKNIKIFADGADIGAMKEAYASGNVSGNFKSA